MRIDFRFGYIRLLMHYGVDTSGWHPPSFARSLSRSQPTSSIHPSPCSSSSLFRRFLSLVQTLFRSPALALGCSKKVCQKIEGVLVKKFNVLLFSLQPEIHYKKFKLVILLACRPAVRGNFFVHHHPLERRLPLSARSLSHLLST